jgi:cell wall-associated NlpC family hydrolase/putative cell wall-binding protein
MRTPRRIACALLGTLAILLVFLAAAAPVEATVTFNPPLSSSSGSHIENAILLSQRAFPDGAPVVVLATADSYSLSLSAGVLAAAYEAPLLLSSSSSLAANTAAELARLRPEKVFIVGLPSLFVSSVLAALPGLDPSQVTVLYHADPYETAALVAAEVGAKLGPRTQVVIAPGDSFGNALAASALACAQGWPLLLTPTAGPFPEASADAISDLGATRGIVVGTQVDPDIPDFEVVTRVLGATSSSDPDGRYDACVKLADHAAQEGWLSYEHVGLARGDDFPDAMVLAPYLARDRGILLFANPSGLTAASLAALKAHGTEVQVIDFIGLSQYLGGSGWALMRQVKSLNSARVTALSAGSGPVEGGNSLTVTGTGISTVTKVVVGKTELPAETWRIDSDTRLTILALPPASGPGPAEVKLYNYWWVSPANVKDICTYVGEGPAIPADKVVQEALKYVGVRYVWGGASPSAGFDCSGLTMYVYGLFGISLPHRSLYQATYGSAVSKEDLLPGDLVFFYTPISHVGLYVGGGLMINAPRQGDLVTIEDAFRPEFVKARRLMSPYTRYEQNDSRLLYSGSWTAASTSSASGGSFRYSLASGASVTVSFKGTSLIWLAKKSPSYGLASVCLDGGAAVTVDLYSSTTKWIQKVWTSGPLSYGTHTVTIKRLGVKSASSGGTYINVDAFDILGSLAQATAQVSPPPPPPGVTRYEQDSSKIAYSGTWLTYYASGASGGSYQYADSPASATITFTGTRLDWIATKGYTQGKASVSLDGGAAVTVDLYNSTTQRQVRVWSSGELSPGTHTVKITWLGQRSVSSGGTRVNIDAVEVWQ